MVLGCYTLSCEQQKVLLLHVFQKNVSRHLLANFAKALSDLHEKVRECEVCHAMTDIDYPTCAICTDPKRDNTLLCVVEDYLDMLSIDRTGVFRGRYHVLGGVISPIQ